MHYFITCLIAFCLYNPVSAQRKEDPSPSAALAFNKLNKAQLKADFETLQYALVETYGGIYRMEDSLTVQKRFDRYRKQLASINNQGEFISLLTTLVASFRDGHMKVGYDDDTNYLLNNSKLFPFTVMVENGKLMIFFNETGSNQTIIPGMEILSINERKAEQLIKAMQPHISADGYGNAHRNKRLADNFAKNLWLYFARHDQFTIKAKDSTGKVVTAKVAGITEAQRQVNRPSPVNLKAIEGVRKLERRGPNVLLNFTNAGEIGNLRIQGFQGKNFENELDSVFKLINQKNAKILILDLRGNGGGEDMYGAALVSHLTSAPFRYFKKIQMRTISPSFGGWSNDLLNALNKGTIKEPSGRYLLTAAIHPGVNLQQPSVLNFKGKLFVLTDGYTFSTAADAAAVIRQNTSAFFIGEETGGGAEGNTSGLFVEAKLHNSGLTVNIPMWCYWNAVTVRKKNRGVLTNHPLLNTVNDIIKGKDRQWEYTVALAQKSNEYTSE